MNHCEGREGRNHLRVGRVGEARARELHDRLGDPAHPKRQRRDDLVARDRLDEGGRLR